MKYTLSPVIVLLAVITGHAADFPVAGFGATGDGKTDDGPAIRKAVEAAMVAGAGSRVVFEKIQKGYSHPVDVYESIGIKSPKKDWGVVFDPVERHRRWDVNMHFFMEEIIRSPAGAGVARASFSDESKKDLIKVRPGDRYVISYKFC